MSKKGLKTMLVCIVLLIGLVTLFACNKSDVADKDGQTKVIVKIQDEDGSIYKENVVFSDLFTLSLQKEGYTGRLYRDADFLKPLTKDSKVKNGDTVYVKWTINSYTVTFMDGKNLLKAFTNVTHGDTVTAPEVPKKDGKTFKKWDKDFSKVTSDLTINAVYDVDTFTVTFKDGDTVLSTQTVEYDKSATAPTVTPAPGKEHTGWDVKFDHVQDNLVVNATFKDIMYTVKFVADGMPIREEKVKYGEKVDAPNAPEVKGKTFERWDGTAEYVTENVTITAIYKLNSYTITFVLGNGKDDVVLTQDYGTAITAPTPKMSGYTFAGWDKTVPETMPANDVTITAKWKINQYTITFVLGNGKDNVVLTQNYGTAITAPENPVREGYTFGGWDKTIPETVPAEDVTITAKWTVNQYTITFVLGNGKDNVVLTQNYGTAITAPTPKMSGYTFAGWDKTVPETVPAENLTITAQWTVNQYTITFVLGNGKDNVVLTQDFGTAITAPVPEDTAEQSFDGWDKAVPETVPAEDVTITAKWKTRQYTLTFIDHNGGKVYGTSLEWGALVEDEYYTANGKVEENNIITGPFQYEGWYDQSDTEKTIIEDFSELTMPTRDLTYVLKLSLMDSAIGDFKVNTPADFTYDENNSAVFTVNGTPYPGVTYKYIWTINKDNVIYKTEETTGSSLTLQNLDAGKYFAKVRIVASKEGCGSVEKDFSAGETLIVSRADISGIEVVKDFTMIYGDKTAKIEISGYREGDVITYKKDEVGEEFKENVDLWALNAGEYGYYVRIDRGDNYNPYTSGKITVKINKAEVTATVTPDDDTLTYGNNLPSLTATINGETYKIESGKYTLQLKDGMQAITGSVANNVGTYNINVDVKKSGLRENYPNYEITVETKGTIKINEAKLTVTVSLDKTELTYGEVLPKISYKFDGLKLLDAESDFTITETKFAEKLDVGTYTASVTLSGDKTKFYNITVNEVSFKVNKKSATITVNKVDDIVYGSEEPALSASVTELVSGDNLSYKPETDYSVGKKPGKYNVYVVFDKNAEANKNYDVKVAYTNKTFQVTQRDLTIKLPSKDVSVGNVAKTYTVEVGNPALFIGELATGDVIEGNVSITSSEGGTFSAKDFQKNIVIKNAADEDVTACCYKISYEMSVTFVVVNFAIEFADKTVTYNGAPQNVDLVTTTNTNYAITYGTAENECNAKSLSELNCINVRPYPYTIYFKVVDNDTLADYVGSVTLTINKKAVEIKVKDVTITYGETPKFECTVTGLVEGETLSGEAVYSGAGTDAGDYEISVSGLTASDNYKVTFVTGKLTINKKPDTVTWNIAESYVYSPAGQTLPTATYDGKTANLIFTKDGKECEFKNAGTYTVTIADNNYILTNNEKTIVIEKATYADPEISLTDIYYDPNKTLGKDYKIEGITWVNPDEVPVCTKTEYAAKYNMDPANYEDFETKVTLVLQKATTVTLAQNLFEFDYDGTSHEIKAVVTYNGVALDTSLYSLTYDGKTSKTYTDAGTHRTLVTMEADNYDLPKNTYVYVKVKGVKVKKGNEVTYHTIEDALFNSQSGDTIEFINGVKEVSFAPSDVAEAIYVNDAFRMVKGGVTLILASDEDSSAKIGKPTYGAGLARYVDTDSSKIKYKLILNKSTVLEVYGNILIQGLLGVNGQGLSGHTSGNHSQIINNGTIKLNSGANLDLRGYIKGTGTVEAREGAKVYSPFVIRDFRGGTSSKKTYEEGVSPFNVYEMPNIQCLYRVEYGATHTAYMDLYSGTLNKHFSSSQNVIANNTAIIILKDKSAGLIKTYDRESEKSNLTIYGNVELGDLSLDWSGIPIKMSKVRFPIPWNYSINIGDGIETTNLTAKYDYKIMTGATINVNKNATVNLTGTVVVYKSFTDVAYGNCVYPNKEAGKLNIEGLLNVTGGIAGELFGRAGGQVVIGNKATLSLSSREGYAKRNPVIVSFIEVATISATAELINADGKITAKTDRTYNYNNGKWTWQ